MKPTSAPDPATAYFHQGNHLLRQGQFDKAENCYEKVLQLDPHFTGAYMNLGIVQRRQGKLHESVQSYQQELQLHPHMAEAHYGLGNVLFECGELDRAIASFRAALDLRSHFVEAWTSLGFALDRQNKLKEAIASYQQAIEIEPNHVNAHFNLALACLRWGDFERGWIEYEWRFKKREMALPSFSQPLWDGSPLHGQSILLYTEQGFGDAIQFIRYLPLVAQCGGSAIVQCPAALVQLFSSIEGIAQFALPDADLPTFDVHCPLLSLPGIFATTLETIPNSIPYLDSDCQSALSGQIELERVESYRLKENGSFKVGIVWASGYNEQLIFRRDYQRRSCPLSQFVQLLAIPDISLYSLQVGRHAADIVAFPCDRLQDLSHLIHDFADTAALIDQLDLVISVDTAVAHLAGAMGKAVWTLLPFASDWRWMLEREDTPWYPTMRLFRQPHAGDWAGAIARIEQTLRQHLGIS